MSEFEGVRLVEAEPEPTTVVLSPKLVDALNHKARALGADLGFAVTLPDIIAWMDRRIDMMIHAQQAQVPVPESHATPNARIVGVTSPVGASRELTASEIVEVARLVAAGTKINAIKFVRERTQAGLKEAKDYVEQNFPQS